MISSPLLTLDAVSKSYGGVRALENVTWSVAPGEVHALCGENGAGKSTLIKILTGVVRPDGGTITFGGKPLSHGDVHASELAGIAAIHQESTAFPDLNVVDNLFVGRELRGWGGFKLDYAAMRQRAKSILTDLGESIDIRATLNELSFAQRQMVSIGRAFVGNCRLLIMDEPTASLSARESETLFNLIHRLRGNGISVLYVSHRLDEIFMLADRITVLRDGRLVETRPKSEISRERLIELMVGRHVSTTTNHPSSSNSTDVPPLLEVKNLSRASVFESISFEVKPGEIVGLGGLVGAGRSEVARAIFGIDDYDSGQVTIEGKPLEKNSVRSSMSAQLALVPEDRQREGLISPLSIRSNVSLAILRVLGRWGGIPFRRERQIVDEQLNNLHVKYASSQQPASNLSGGNQQKLVLGKWLATHPKVLILDEPTCGVDVGAKSQFHDLIREFAAKGMAVLLISSDLPELLSLSDRIVVMRNGKISGHLNKQNATQTNVLELALPDGAAVVGESLNVQ